MGPGDLFVSMVAGVTICLCRCLLSRCARFAARTAVPRPRDTGGPATDRAARVTLTSDSSCAGT